MLSLRNSGSIPSLHQMHSEHILNFNSALLDFRFPPRKKAENCTLLGYYAAISCNFLPTFRYKLHPEKSVRNFHYPLRNTTGESSSNFWHFLLPRKPAVLLVVCARVCVGPFVAVLLRSSSVQDNRLLILVFNLLATDFFFKF